MIRTTVEIDINLQLLVRDKTGTVIDSRAGHNIMTGFGSEWLAKRIAYSSFSPLTEEDNFAIGYIGLGIGGTRQNALGVVNAAPYSVSYPGTNVQTDINPNILALERPVRLTGSNTAYPGQGADVWLGRVQAPANHPEPNATEFRRLFDGQTELAYGTFLSVPVSEVGLFLYGTSPTYIHTYNNRPLFYDTFDTITITSAVSLEVIWTIYFGEG